MEVINEFGDLAPVINVVNIAGCLNPKLIDEETVVAIAQSTGTPKELVECVVEAVDDVNNMIDNGVEPETAIQNFSRGMLALGEVYRGTDIAKQCDCKPRCTPNNIARITFALHPADLATFDSSDLADHICQFVPATFDVMETSIKAAQNNLKQSSRSHNFSNAAMRKNMSLAVVGKALANAATNALTSGKQILTKVAQNPTVKNLVEGATTAKNTVVNSDAAKIAAEAAMRVKHEAAPIYEAVASGQIFKTIEAELPAAKAALTKLGSGVVQLGKDILHGPFELGLKGELINVPRLKEQKVLSQKAVDFMNKVKGVSAYDLGNTTLEVDIIKNNILRTKGSLLDAAKKLKKGEISTNYFDSLSKEFTKLLQRNTKVLAEIKESSGSLGKIKELTEVNKNFLTTATDITSKFNAGQMTPEAFAKNFEAILKPLKRSTFGQEALADFKAATNKQAAASKIIKTVRADASEMTKCCEKIGKNIDKVEALAKNELATLQPITTAAISEAQAGGNKLLEFINSKSKAFQQAFVRNGVKSAKPEVVAASKLEKEYHSVMATTKSVLGKIAATGVMAAVPTGLIWYGLGRDENKALSYLTAEAETLRAQIRQLEQQIIAEGTAVESATAEVVNLDPLRRQTMLSSIIAAQYATSKNFSSVFSAIGSKLLFPVAPLVLSVAASIFGVAAVEAKIKSIAYTEKQLKNDIAELCIKRNELQQKLAEIKNQTKCIAIGKSWMEV